MSARTYSTLRRTIVLSLVFSIVLPVRAGHRFAFQLAPEALAVVGPDPACLDQWNRRDSKNDILQKCVDRLSKPNRKRVGNQKKPPCIHEFEALIQAAKELGSCLTH